MRLNFNFLLFFFIALILFGCKKNINLKIPEKDPFLVVNAVLSNDAPVSIQLSSSIKALSNQEVKLINNAEVKIIVNNTQQFLLPYKQEGYYYDTLFKAYTGSSYSVQINAKGYKPIYAQTTLPTPALVDTTYYIKKLSDPSGIKIGVTVNDPSVSKDYYQLTIYQMDSLGNVSKRFIDVSDDAKSITSTPTVNNFTYSGSLFFNDEFLNGKKIENQFSTYVDVNYDSTGNPLNTQNLLIAEVSKLSADFYLYNWSLNKYNETSGNPFSEPVQVFSNITGGLGILGAKTSVLKVINKR